MPDQVTQVVPALPPAVSGLGDYAAALAGALDAHGVRTRFVTMAPAAPAASGWSMTPLSARSGTVLADALEGSEVTIAHVSGYGYARWGLCWWLAEGLRSWRRRDGKRRLVTIFHELYASGPPWRTSFWTSPAQRAIAHRLAAASDGIVTTSPTTAARVREWDVGGRIAMMPVFSNVGEIDSPSPLADRAPVAVVFGGGRRVATWTALSEAADEVGHALRSLGVAEIWDIGPPISTVPTVLAGAPVTQLGPLPPAEVARHLANARVGLVDYPRHVLTKSGIVAAYLAHGTLCVNTSRVGELPADLAEGREFAHPARLAGAVVDAEAVAAAGHRWYRGHDVAATAALFHELIG